MGNVQDYVYSSLRRSIINLNLIPGTAISEKEISLRYEVSRTPVREAFIHLSKEGLVKVIPQRETLVSLIDLDRVEQELFLRESLEMAVLEPCISRCGQDHIAKLEKIVETQRAAFDRNEYINFINFDDQYHQVFFEVAGHNLGWEVLESMCGHYHRARLLTVWLNGIAQNILNQHIEILSAVKRKDIRESRFKLARHLNKLHTETEMLREKFPGYFASARENSRAGIDWEGGGPYRQASLLQACLG